MSQCFAHVTKSLADNSMHLQDIYMYMYTHVGMFHLYDRWILGTLAIVALATCRFGKCWILGPLVALATYGLGKC